MQGGMVVFMDETEHYQIGKRHNQFYVNRGFWQSFNSAVWALVGLLFILWVIGLVLGVELADKLIIKVVGG